MSFEVVVVFALIVVALVLFAWERFSFDVTAFILLGVLLVTGIITPEEGLAGFSNTAVVTIGAMFILSDGLRRTGFLDLVGDQFTRYGKGQYGRTLVLMMATVGVVSGFINNTAAVALFIPIVIGVAGDIDVSPSKLLIPISFASMFGGVCTLIGTSTNLLVSSIAEDNGLAAFSMFEFTPVGLAFFGAGFLYLVTAGVRLLPARRSGSELTQNFDMRAYITDVEIQAEADVAGQTLADAAFTRDLDLDVLEVLRAGDRRPATEREEDTPEEKDSQQAGEERDVPSSSHTQRTLREDVEIHPGDVFRIRGSASTIDQLLQREGLRLKPTEEWVDADLERGEASLVEAVVAPDSAIAGRPVEEVGFMDRFGAILLAIRHHGDLERDDLRQARLTAGDSVLLLMDPDRFQEVAQDDSFVLVSEVDTQHRRRRRMPLALAILLGVVVTAASGLAPIVVSAVVGALLLVMTGCVTTDEAYQAVNWKVIFLLAGILPLGTAMDTTGAAQLLADQLLELLSAYGPHAVLAGFLGVTMLLTGVVTNNATAVLLAPVAISAGSTLGVDPKPLLMGVTYAASLSFITPFGYQTNTLVYGPGEYAFTDYTKVGTPLNLLFLALGTWLIPIVFPF